MSLLTPPILAARRLRWLNLVVGLAATAAGRVTGALAGWRHRHATLQLARADDRLLADLGLTRGDLNDALSGPPWEDPTILLRARALERRLTRHRVAHGFRPARYY